MIQTRRSGTEYGGRGAAREVRLADHQARGLTGGERSRVLQDPVVVGIRNPQVAAGVERERIGSIHPRRSRHGAAVCEGVLADDQARGLMGREWSRVLQDPVSVGNPEIPAGIERDGIGGIQSFLADLIVDRREVRLTDDEARGLVGREWSSVLQNSLVEQVRNPEIPAGIEREAIGTIQSRRRRRHGVACEVRLADHQARGLTGGKGSFEFQYSVVAGIRDPEVPAGVEREAFRSCQPCRCGREGVCREARLADHQARGLVGGEWSLVLQDSVITLVHNPEVPAGVEREAVRRIHSCRGFVRVERCEVRLAYHKAGRLTIRKREGVRQEAEQKDGRQTKQTYPHRSSMKKSHGVRTVGIRLE